MKARTIKKWKRRGVYEKMMRRRGHERCPAQAIEWSPNYVGETSLIDAYRQLQTVDPTNPLLRHGVLDGTNHFQIQPEFYQEQFPDGPSGRSSGVVRYLNLLRQEYEKKCPVSPRNQPRHSGLLGLF